MNQLGFFTTLHDMMSDGETVTVILKRNGAQLSVQLVPVTLGEQQGKVPLVQSPPTLPGVMDHPEEGFLVALQKSSYAQQHRSTLQAMQVAAQDLSSKNHQKPATKPGAASKATAAPEVTESASGGLFQNTTPTTTPTETTTETTTATPGFIVPDFID